MYLPWKKYEILFYEIHILPERANNYVEEKWHRDLPYLFSYYIQPRSVSDRVFIFSGSPPH